MILNDQRIRKLAKNNQLISPFEEKYLQSESYDLHMGDRVYAVKNHMLCIDLKDSNSLDHLYEEQVISEQGFLLFPKKFVLVTLRETLCLPDLISAHVRPRTRFTRAGLYVSSQHCNTSYQGNLQLGLYNLQDIPIKIYAGMGICQIIFEELEEKPSSEKLYRNKVDAQYHKEQEFRGPIVDEAIREQMNDIVNYFLGEDSNG